MPTRTLDEAERGAYARYPERLDADALARCFHLDGRDRAHIAGLRGDHNRVGFAAQLGTVRLLGVLPGTDTQVPAAAIVAPSLASSTRLRLTWGPTGPADSAGAMPG